MKCIILCAGYAMRLYPLTENQPKPLLKIAEKAIVEHILEKISEIDEIRDVYIITNNKFYSHFSEWVDEYKSKTRLKIKVINDGTKSNDDRLGAIGDIDFVIKKEKIKDDVLIVSGDNLFEFGLLGIYAEHKKKNRAIIALYDVKRLEEAKKFGIVMADENLKITGFEEKPLIPKSTLASIGIYFYPKNSINKIGQYLKEGNSKDAPGYFIKWLHQREHVHGYVFDSDTHKWFDIGSHESLKEADEHYRKKLKHKSRK